MRVADKMLFNQVNHNLQKNRADMSELQNKAATLKRVTRPSDDPLAATRVLSYRTEEQSSAQFHKTAAQAKALLDFSDQSLFELTNVLMRAKELVLGQASDGTGNQNSRRVVAEEIEQLYSQAIQIGNRKMGEKYLFGGYQTSAAPFQHDGEYKGDDGEIRMAINKDTWIPVNVPGSKVFLGKAFLDHEVGDETVVEPRNLADLKKAQDHEKNLRNPEQRQDLEQGQKLRGPASLRVDADGKQDDGDKKLNSEQEKQFVNLRNSKEDGVNIIDVLRKTHISMKADDKAGLQDMIEELDKGIQQIVMARAELGARASTLDANVESLTKAKIDVKEAASQLEDADQFQVISDITKADGTLKATLQTSGKLIQPSLLDFLR